MTRTIRRLLALAVLGATLPLPRATAQAPAMLPLSQAAAPTTTTAPQFDPLPGFPHPPEVPRSLLAPAPLTPPYGCANLPEPYFVHDPLLDPPDFPQPGWLFSAEVGLVGPHIYATGTLAAGLPNGDVVNLPVAGFDWTAAPRLLAGYRLPSGFGEFALAYRGLSTDGNGSAPGLDTTAALRSRLDFNEVDFDYLSREFSLMPHWDMKWHAGLRYLYLYFDSRADEPFPAAAAGSGIFEQRFSNSYWGVGPDAGLELARHMEGSGLSFVGRLDAGGVLGRIRQGFFDRTVGLVDTEARFSGSQEVPMLSVETGVSWKPAQLPQAELFVGYDVEYWWHVGSLNSLGTAANMSMQGVLVRLAINY